MASLTIIQRGSTDPRGRGDTWQLRVRHHGRDHYRYVRQASRADAERAGARFLTELTELGAPSVPPSTTFGTWAESWFKLAAPGLAAATAKRYRELLDLHLLPRWQTRRLPTLGIGDALALQREMLAADLSPSTVWSALRLAKAIVAEATRLRVLPQDPFAAVRHVRQPPATRAVLAPERFARVARIAPESDVGDLIRLALATGLRRGELLGLRWADIEPDAGRATDFSALHVTGSLCGTTGARKAPKTRTGARRVALPPDAAAMLRARRLRAAETALAAGRPLDSLPVFPGPDGLSWANADSVSQAVGRALPEGVSLHGLRHAHATALLSAGINPRAVQGRLGHADIRTTLGIYGHALPADDAAAVAVLDAAIGTAS